MLSPSGPAVASRVTRHTHTRKPRDHVGSARARARCHRPRARTGAHAARARAQTSFHVCFARNAAAAERGAARGGGPSRCAPPAQGGAASEARNAERGERPDETAQRRLAFFATEAASPGADIPRGSSAAPAAPRRQGGGGRACASPHLRLRRATRPPAQKKSRQRRVRGAPARKAVARLRARTHAAKDTFSITIGRDGAGGRECGRGAGGSAARGVGIHAPRPRASERRCGGIFRAGGSAFPPGCHGLRRPRSRSGRRLRRLRRGSRV